MSGNQYRFPQEDPGLLGKIATKAGKAAISLFGEGFVTDAFADRKLPKWYIRAMRESGLWVKCCYSGRTTMISPLITPADRERGFMQEKDHRVGRALLADWARVKYLSDAEWDFLLDVLAAEPWVSYSSSVVGYLADREEVNWKRLERIVNIPGISEALVHTTINKIVKKDYLNSQDGGALFQWALNHPDKERYLDCFYGARLLEGAKISVEPNKWQETIEWLIKVKPKGTLIGVLDLDGRYPGIVSRKDFLGMPKHIFSPWLTDKEIDRDLRIKAIQWLGELGIREAAERDSESSSFAAEEKVVAPAREEPLNKAKAAGPRVKI